MSRRLTSTPRPPSAAGEHAGRPYLLWLPDSPPPWPGMVIVHGAVRHGDRLIAVSGRLASSDGFMSRYELRVEFPVEGRWHLAVVDRRRRFEFPAVGVGSGRVPQDHVSFPKGSMAERQGGGTRARWRVRR